MAQVLYDGIVANPEVEGATPKLVGFMEREEPEWSRTFGKLPGGFSARNELYCEVWQYMGTFFYGDSIGWVHDFRHRAFPGSNERLYARIAADKGWTPKTTTKY